MVVAGCAGYLFLMPWLRPSPPPYSDARLGGSLALPGSREAIQNAAVIGVISVVSRFAAPIVATDAIAITAEKTAEYCSIILRKRPAHRIYIVSLAGVRRCAAGGGRLEGTRMRWEVHAWCSEDSQLDSRSR